MSIKYTIVDEKSWDEEKAGLPASKYELFVVARQLQLLMMRLDAERAATNEGDLDDRRNRREDAEVQLDNFLTQLIMRTET